MTQYSGINIIFTLSLYYDCYHPIIESNTSLLMLRSLISAVILLSVSLCASARNYFFNHYDTSNGLSQNTVVDILQDHNGYLWFATKDGLNRFDGISFKVFRRNNSGLGNNFINCIHEDKDNHIWIGTEYGVYIYDSQTESISELSSEIKGSGSKLKEAIRCIDVDSNGLVHIATALRGLLRYDSKSDELVKVFPDLGERAVTFYKSIDGAEWLYVYGDDLYFSTGRGNKIAVFSDDSGNHTFTHTEVHAMQLVGHDIYVGTEKGLYCVNRDTHFTTKVSDGFFRTLCLSPDGSNIWAGSQDGIYVVSVSDKNTTHIRQPEFDEIFSLSDNAIYSLYTDVEGTIWIGSYFGGVNYCPAWQMNFEKFYPGHSHPFMGRRVREFCEDNNGSIWIGTEDRGLMRYHPSTDILEPYATHLHTANIHGMCLSGDELFVGAFDGGLERINTKTGSYHTYYSDGRAGSLNSNYVFSLHSSSDGTVWVGTTSGLMLYNSSTDRFENIDSIPHTFIYHITEDRDGLLWISTYSDGVFSYDHKSGKTVHYAYDADTPGTLADSKVIGIFCDSKNRVWVMTHDGGLSLLDRSKGTFSIQELDDSGQCNLVMRVVEDFHGNLWCSTNNGLICYDPDSGNKIIYTTANGLQTNHFNYQSGIIDHSGYMYFGTVNGFIRFRPDIYHQASYQPRIALTSLYIYNQLQSPLAEGSPLSTSIDNASELTLSHNQTSFSISARVLSYITSLNKSLRYKLEGYDDDWRHLDDERSVISYSNLPYGSYTLRIELDKQEKDWNVESRILKIYVNPPFYLSIYAKLLYWLLATGLILFFVRLTIRKNRKKIQRANEQLEHEKQKELYDSKISFFTNIAHEIRTPLTLIKSPLDNILRKGNIPDNIKEDLGVIDLNTGRLTTLVNQLLDFRKTESNGMMLNLQRVNISSSILTLIEVFKPAFKEKGLQLLCDIEENVQAVVDRDMLGKIIANTLSNALKYSQSHITMSLSHDGENFVITESNDGTIVPLDKREEIFEPFSRYTESDEYKGITGTGIGLALTRSLVSLHKGTICMDNDPSINRFIITIPLEQSKPVIDISAEEAIILEESHASENHLSDVVSNNDDTTGKDTTDDVNPTDNDNSSVQPVNHSSKKSHTLLFVEDNTQLLSFLNRHFTSSYRIFTASNGLEALDIISKETISLIISDVMMPEMDGLQLCQKVKENMEFSHIPVILLTAKTALQSRLEGLRYGADSYIDKPFSMPVLEQTILTLLENRQRMYESFTQRPYAIVTTLVGSDTENEFLTRLGEEIQSNMDDSEYDIDRLAAAMNMSRSSLNRKIKATLNMTPNDYIRMERLRKATELLKSGNYKINEVCYMVGFNTPSYFAKCYQKQYGVLPKDIVENKD